MIGFFVASLSLWFLLGTSSFPDLPAFIYFSLILLLFAIVVTRCKRVDSLCLAFIGACVVSLIWNDLLLARIDPVFRSWERLFLFVITFGVYSPMIQSEFATKLRNQLFNCFYWMGFAIVVSSLPKISQGVGDLNAGYAGYANTSLTLGMICGFVACCSFARFLTSTTGFRNTLFYAGQATIAFIVMSAAGSRSALLATVMACFAASIATLAVGQRQDRIKGLGALVIIAGAATAVVAASQSMLAKFTNDIDASTAVGILATSRTMEFGNRIAEFLDSPIFGIGFASANFGIIDWRSGGIESATSWLALLSMTGVCGFALFVLIMYRSVMKSFKCFRENSSESQGLSWLGPDIDNGERKQRSLNLAVFSLCCFFIVHLCFEGYILFAGSTDFALVWLVIGLSENDVSDQFKRSIGFKHKPGT